MATEEENRLVGHFGEFALAFFLTKKGINVMVPDTVFFDIIAKDSKGLVFSKNKITGISVKIRDRTQSTGSCTIPIKDFPKIKSFGIKWNIDPWICHMIVFTDKEKRRVLEGFIFPYKDAKIYFSKGKRKYAVSFSLLRRKIGKKFIKEKNYLKWYL